MITFFNKLGNSWVAKIIFGALALSMLAFWGLGGLSNVSTYDTTNDAIKVGKFGISNAQLNQSFETARKRLTQFTGGVYVSPAKAIEMGVLDQVIQQEVAEAVQHQIGEDLGLTASNKAIQNYVEKNPVFKDNTGKFDKNMFYAYLMQSNLTETQLAHKLKKELAFKHLTDSVEQLGFAPNALAKASYAFKNEKRDIDALILSPDKVTVSKQPTEEEITEYYEDYSEQFMYPEYRTVTVVALTPDLIANRITVDSELVDEMYEEQKDKFNKPEERDLYQIFFKNKEDADKIKAKVTTDNFIKIATEEVGQSENDTHFGMTSRTQLLEELAEPVFKAKKGAIIGPIPTSAGYNIIWIKDIKAAEITPVEKVKAEIRRALALDQAYTDLENLTRKLQDTLGAGATLIEAAKQLDIPTAQIQKMDISGQLADGSQIPDAYSHPELLQAVFIAKEGDFTELFHTEKGDLIAQIDEIIPVSQKPIEKVKDEIKEMWLKEQQEDLFPDIVKELTEKAQKGENLKTLAKQKGTFDVISKTDVLRTNVMPELTNAVDTVFEQEVGVENAQSIPVGQKTAIVIVRKVSKPDLTNATAEIDIEADATKQAIGTVLNQAVVQNYTQEFGIKINQNKIEQLVNMYKGQE